ncbi:MAG: trypsin-like peptidase domain-containing protein [Coleofasciculaceae cyanobacterium]
MNSDLQDSIVLITSSEPNINRFGTGFVIRQVSGTAYLLTCAHVVRDVGGKEKVKAEGKPATVIAFGEEDGLDLAVLRVDGLWGKPSLKKQVAGEKGDAFMIVGFQLLNKAHLIRPLQGQLGEQVGLQSKRLGERIEAWDLQIVDDYFLQPGYSGSPVVDEASGQVLGVVSYRQGEGRSGLAISIEALDKIQRFVDSEQLYGALLKLGYKQQVRLFRKLVKDHAIAALLIHGLPDYGQRWLLNLLLVKHLSYLTASRVVPVGLNRRSRRSDARAIWREFCSRFSLPRNSSLAEIAQAVYQSLQTQNIILIFHNVNWIPRESLKELIQDFWLPLANQVKQSQATADISKLLMFLVDYEGSVGSLEGLFAGKVDAEGTKYTPIKAPKISEFSEDDLMSWLENENQTLPKELVDDLDATVQEILEDSERGIPELTLDEICDRCGCNWYEESEKWLKY